MMKNELPGSDDIVIDLLLIIFYIFTKMKKIQGMKRLM